MYGLELMHASLQSYIITLGCMCRSVTVVVDIRNGIGNESRERVNPRPANVTGSIKVYRSQ